MYAVFAVVAVSAAPFAQHYLCDPGPGVPVLPATALPRAVGGWLPAPGPPSAAHVRAALASVGRVPGDAVVAHRLEREQVGVPRNYPGVGRARLWQLTYRCDVLGPDGPYTLYTDRAALVRVP